MTLLGVLVPQRASAPPPPESLPLGRAALRLREQGVRVVFGAEVADGAVLTGLEATPEGWQPLTTAVTAVYDRFPNREHPERHAAMRRAIGGVPFANSWALTLVCRDKVRTQEVLEAAGLKMPSMVTDPDAFADTVADWGEAFLKPRYGACGRGVARVVPGDPLPREVDGTIPGILEPAFLQAAVPPPPDWAGISVRINAQREGDGWVVNEPVARRSRTDAIVNVGRGAEVRAGSDVFSDATLAALDDQVRRAAAALGDLPDGDWLIEVGVDAMIDADGRPHIIEVNSRPFGRVGALAELDPARFGEAHIQACMRPLRYLAVTAPA